MRYSSSVKLQFTTAVAPACIADSVAAVLC